jgi:diguanylate cyclase (GGDEF)-like protein
VELAARSVQPLCLMMIDVDNFKLVNDQYGHAEGDIVLQLLAASIVSQLRASDYVCRYGGEEFAVLLPQTVSSQAASLAERVVAAIPEALTRGWAGADASRVTVTIGVAAYPSEAASGGELVRLADRRLYAGKSAGRNRVVSSDEATPAARVN